MTAQLLDGRAVAATLREEIEGQVQAFRHEVGFGPALAIVRVGNEPASVSYARQIDKAFSGTGFGYELEVLAEDAPLDELVTLLQRLGREPRVQGVLLQRPLPPAMLTGEATPPPGEPGATARVNADLLMAQFPAEKDVEGVTALNLGKLMLNSGDYFPTSTPSAGITILKHYGIPIQGKHAVVVGRSNILGRPLALLLLHENATVTVCHSRTPELAAYTRQADILIGATGRPNLITAEMVKPGATVIDFGVSFVEGKMVGDVDFENVKEVAGAITPVPGGTGPVTTVMLMRNTLEAARRQTKK